MVADEMRARYRTHDEIRAHGAIGNLADGVETTTHGVATRLIAWPGTGYQTEAVHVLTLQPGESSDQYCYDLAEEAMLCFKGHGEVWLRDSWVKIAPGDIAYFPEGIEHAIRNPAKRGDPLVVVTQITPPQLDLYAARGLYNVELGVMNYDSVHKECTNARPAEMSPVNEMAYHDTQPKERAWNLGRRGPRRGGTVQHLHGRGVHGHRAPDATDPLAGSGLTHRRVQLRVRRRGCRDIIHKHPVSDECLVMWQGRGQFFVGNQWVDAGPTTACWRPAVSRTVIAATTAPRSSAGLLRRRSSTS